MKKYLENKEVPFKLNLQLFGGEKSKLEKHLEELGENTSGGAHDAVTFSGRGLGFLRDLFKSSKKKAVEEPDDDDMEDDDDDIDDEPKARKTKKSAASKANGGSIEEEDEDLEDPADENGNDIIANKGKRKPKDSLRSAVSKSHRFDERRFEKHVEEEFEDVLDATPALAELAKSMRSLGKSVNGTLATIEEVQDQNLLLAKAVRELLKSQAALAADLEEIKKQPATSPASGFVVLNKGENGSSRKLRKSDLEDALTDMMNDGWVEARTVARLANLNSDMELREFVDSLPSKVRERL